ncbi:MAG: head-tail connector protein [Dethiosulfatibacter sp.]|nr:head-tail connector protein [Dethiosulfatibacter sp.]
MKIRVKTQPTTEPVSVSTVKEYLRIDGTFSDTQLSSLITAGRQMAENFTNISIAEQVIELAFDHYPPNAISLPKGPIKSVDAITLTDVDGVTSSVLTSSYVIDYFDSRIVKKASAVHPVVTLQESNGFVVEYTAGFDEVPEAIKEAIILYIKGQYDCVPAEEYINSFKTLLYPYKVVSV